MAVNPMDEPAYLKGLCLCTDHRDCREPPVRTSASGSGSGLVIAQHRVGVGVVASTGSLCAGC